MIKNISESPITKRTVSLKSYDDLVTNDTKLKKEIEDKFLIEKPAQLSVDYSQYENFVNFSSAKSRLENFKYKVKEIEKFTQESASYAENTLTTEDAVSFENSIREIQNNFDGYESYLYNYKSIYVTSSMGEFHDASWPKTGSGTYENPYKPISSSHADFISWYGSVNDKTGQIYSASLYDQENGNRLINLLPQHIVGDVDNSQFLDFISMTGQHFDELWSYTKSITDVSDRRVSLEDGFSKDLIFNLAKSLGWDVQDGKDLLDLSRHGFGRKQSGDSYSLYTSGSLDSPTESDVSKEITKRIVSSMPFLLKSKGTAASIRGLLNCYGIPGSILQIREYGGMTKDVSRTSFEVSRRFTKALGFRGNQFVSSSWSDDSDTSRKQETVELRFRSVSGSNQTLIQKDDDWAIRLKDNGSIDNNGTVSFILSGSDGQQEVSSSLLPVFDGDYYSLMLKKEKVEIELFPFSSFETSSLFNPPFIAGSDGQTNSAEYGNIQIVSSSNVAKIGTKSLRHINTSDRDENNISYTKLFKGNSSSITDVSQGETYSFSAYAKVSGSTVDSVGRLRIFELDSNEEVVNWDEDVDSTQVSITSLGGVRSSEIIGLDESEWKRLSVTKTMRFPNVSKLGVRFENLKPQSTIFWDEVSVRKVSANTDSIFDSFKYSLFVKKYESGLDRIIHNSNVSLSITGSNTSTSSYNASWTGSGDLYLGGKTNSVFGNQLTGSLMEFRTWSEPLKEQYFNNHVSNPKSYIGNSPSSSYNSLITRYSFDDNEALTNTSTIRDVSSNQTTTTPGYAFGFGGLNTFESVVDDTKTVIPNYGPNRRSTDKIRIEDNYKSGSSSTLYVNRRVDISENDFAPIDSPKIGIYFSPTDVVNNDIVASFANLDFNQLLGDPRDNFELEYPELRDSANDYFKKYTDNNDFWDYMHLIKFYDQSIFKHIKKLIPSRSKPHLGTVVEPNLFERSKNPIQRNDLVGTLPKHEAKLNLTNFHFNESTNEASHSVLTIETEYPNFVGEIDSSDTFLKPSLYRFEANDNFDDRNTYVSGTAIFGGPSHVFSEATGSVISDSKLSENNQYYKFTYDSEHDYSFSSKYSIDSFENLYSSRSLHESDLDSEYQNITSFKRLFYEGVKNTSETTIDGDLPFIVTTTAPTVAVPTTKGISKLSVDQKGGKKKITPKKRPKRRRRR